MAKALTTFGRLQNYAPGRQIDTADHQAHKGLKGRIGRHYDAERGGFVSDREQDPLLCDGPDRPTCYVWIDKQGKDHVGGIIPDGVWFGVVGDKHVFAVQRQINAMADLRAVVQSGTVDSHVAPVRLCGTIQGPVEASKSLFPVWEPCARCGAPVNPDGETACWIEQQAYCTGACYEASVEARTLPPREARTFTQRWTDRLYWNSLLGWTWERVPAA